MIWIERQARYILTIKLPEKKAEYVNQAGLNYIESYLIKSIIAGNGLLSELEGVDSYFAHA
ncbi:ISSag3, transposase family protein [Streptococcus sp. oral taxon 056 str. F0418]|nr:ISSag3, transposase family protein [Streptococcus sp. oral taxon 056 str. F0418]